MSTLSDKKCIPCSGGVPPLPLEQRQTLLKELNENWSLTHENNRLFRRFEFSNYKKAWSLLNQISEVAEEQGHHPDLALGWGYLEVQIWTHKIDSLVESDFIFAAKVDELHLKTNRP